MSDRTQMWTTWVNRDVSPQGEKYFTALIEFDCAAAARRGDLRAAQHWTKVATAMAAASAARPATLPDQNEQERLAELRRRIQRFVEADQDIQRWEKERDHYWAMMQTAVGNGTEPPPPLRPHPAGPLGPPMEESFMKDILVGPEPRE